MNHSRQTEDPSDPTEIARFLQIFRKLRKYFTVEILRFWNSFLLNPFYIENQRGRVGRRIWESLLHLISYLLTDLDVNLVPPSMPANQGRGFMEILHCGWLPPKAGHVKSKNILAIDGGTKRGELG